MDVALHTRVVAVAFVFNIALLGQKQPNGQAKMRGASCSSQSLGRSTTTQAPTHPTAPQIPNGNVQQQMRGQSSGPSTPAGSLPTEPKESFSQLTLFLFASGLALFVALLGWSDQIRGIDKDTRELENRFLEKTGIKKRDFLRVVKPESADQQLEALTEIVNAGLLKTKGAVDLLRTFTKRTERSPWSQIERLSAWKYNLTMALTITLFVAGVASLFTTPALEIRLHGIEVRAEMAIIMVPMTLIGILLIIIICSARQEKALRSLLNSMADSV